VTSLERDADVVRVIRVLGILNAGAAAGLAPMSIGRLHVIAYLADAMSPVYGIAALDPRILKRAAPFYPLLQRDVDWLVGRGVVIANNVSHVLEEGAWRLEASFSLNRFFADPILSAAVEFAGRAAELEFLTEVVYAASSLADQIDDVSGVDATYGDPYVDYGQIVDVNPDDGSLNESARLALRFGDVVRDERDLTAPEMIHLYVRHLFGRMQAA